MQTTKIETTSTIKIAGLKREIISYDKALQMEQGCEANGFTPLSMFQYNSILFNNLGYKYVPSNIDWIKKGRSIEEVSKDTLNNSLKDEPITIHLTRIIDNMDLKSILEIIKFWIIGDIERGNLLDVYKSFDIPEEKEVLNCIENNFEIKRKSVVEKKLSYWTSADILTRRKYYLNPNVNEKYFIYCIKGFENYLDQIIVIDPIAIFTSALIDPDILMSSIRNAEIEACKYVSDNDCFGYAAFIDDYNCILKFVELFRKKMIHISNIFRKQGAIGFAYASINNKKNKKEITKEEAYKAVGYLNMSATTDGFANMTEQEQAILQTKQEIANYNIKDIKKEVFKYIDRNSIPKEIGDPKVGKNGTQEYSQDYYNLIRKLYYVIDFLNQNYPEMLDSKDRLKMSDAFYVNPDVFALYCKSLDTFVYTNDRMTIERFGPKQMIDIFKMVHCKDGKMKKLDSSMFGENLNSKECEDIKIEDIDDEKKDKESKKEETKQEVIIEKPEPKKEEKKEEVQEEYSFDPNKYVELQ